jgi:hypothetical protein
MSQTIEISIEEALALIQNALPVLEAVPAIAPEAGLASLAVSGAQVITPILFKMGNDLASKGVIAAEVQADQLNRLQKLMDFSASEWQPSTAGSGPTSPPQPS